jgi:DNA-binding CsgD family transcriptional regulator
MEVSVERATFFEEQWWLRTTRGSRGVAESGQAENPLEFARVREMPRFFVVDDAMRVVFHTNDDAVSEGDLLPDGLTAVVAPLTQQLARSMEANAIGILSPTQVVRVIRLDAGKGAQRYAVMLERFAARNSVAKAAQRFRLSERETEVLDGLMRGESTNAIAKRLGIGTATVQEHIRKIGHKTNVTKRSAIVATVFGLQ